jgi:hypothetical protein
VLQSAEFYFLVDLAEFEDFVKKASRFAANRLLAQQVNNF